MSSLGLMDNEWQEREQNLLRQLEDERFRCCPPTPPPLPLIPFPPPPPPPFYRLGLRRPFLTFSRV